MLDTLFINDSFFIVIELILYGLYGGWCSADGPVDVIFIPELLSLNNTKGIINSNNYGSKSGQGQTGKLNYQNLGSCKAKRSPYLLAR